MNRSEAEANRLLSEKTSPSWQRPAPCRNKAKKPVALLPQWLLNYLWKK